MLEDWENYEEFDDYEFPEDMQSLEVGCCLPDCLVPGIHYTEECFNREMIEGEIEKEPISIINCEHDNRLFVKSEEIIGDRFDRTIIHVCDRCGEFQVYIKRGDLSEIIAFALPTHQLVRAAGRYADFLSQEANDPN